MNEAIPVSTHRRRFTRLVRSFAAVPLLVSALPGCDGATPASPGGLSRHLFVGIGSSLSDRKAGVGPIAANARFVSDLLTGLDSRTDSFTLWKVDNRCEEIASGPAPRSLRAFAPGFQAALLGRSNEPSRPDKFWAAVAERSASRREPFAAVFATDGASEGTDLDAAGHRRIADAAKRLAANRFLRAVRVVGAAPGTRERIRKDLAALGEKLDFLEPTDDPYQIINAIQSEARR